MDINAYRTCSELPYANRCTNKMHELVRLIFREDQEKLFQMLLVHKIFLFPSS